MSTTNMYYPAADMKLDFYVNLSGYAGGGDIQEFLMQLCSAFDGSYGVKAFFHAQNGAAECGKNAALVSERLPDRDIPIIFIEADTQPQHISRTVFDYVGAKLYCGCRQETVRLFGIDAAAAKSLLALPDAYSPECAVFCYGKGHITAVKALFSADDSGALSDIYGKLNRYVYAESDVTLSQRLLDLLSVRKKTIAVAESLTGGAIAKALIDNPGASRSVMETVTTYSNESKVSRLGVSPETIASYGAVSPETAYQMAAGLLCPGTDIALATTGIAGPDGGTMTKPVGLTYIAVGSVSAIHVYKHIFKGSRTQIRDDACGAAMFYACKYLKDGGINYEELVIK